MVEGCKHLIISVDQAPVDLGDPRSNLNIKKHNKQLSIFFHLCADKLHWCDIFVEKLLSGVITPDGVSIESDLGRTKLWLLDGTSALYSCEGGGGDSGHGGAMKSFSVMAGP